MFKNQKNLALWLGFGGLLFLMGGLGASAVSFLHQMEVRHELIRNEFVSRNRTLDDLRSDLFLSGTHIRDFLLESGPAAAAKHETAYRDTQLRIRSATAKYQKSLRDEEKAVFGTFTRGLLSYFETLEPVFRWKEQERQIKRYSFIQQQLTPRRMAIVNLADNIDQVNEKLMESSTAEAIELFSLFRFKLFLLVALALGVGFLLAGTSLWRILKLERDAEARFAEATRARSELQSLSSRVLAAQEEERRKLSRELHDEVGQVLWAMSLAIGNLQSALQGEDYSEALHQVDCVRGMAENSARVVRNMSLLLRPSMLDDLGLLPALKWLGREMSRTMDLQVDIAADEVPDEFPDEHKTCIYRVVQEALRNCSRHARARYVRIHLELRAQQLVLQIRDDGVGFDPVHDKGLGLLGIEERVGHLGGKVRIDSAPGKGTTIQLYLPVGTTEGKPLGVTDPEASAAACARDYEMRPFRTA